MEFIVPSSRARSVWSLGSGMIGGVGWRAGPGAASPVSIAAASVRERIECTKASVCTVLLFMLRDMIGRIDFILFYLLFLQKEYDQSQ